MSLAFDKQGKPFTWHKRTAKLRVRLFRTPSARGTCCQVLDAAGAPLFVDADIDYTEFRRAVAGVPGLYRLDQCDEDGVEIEDAAPAYVSIEQLRNAGGPIETTQAGDTTPLVIIERLVALHADVMKTMAGQHAAILASSAEIMRAPYRPSPLVLPATELRNTDGADDRAEDDDDDVDETSAFAPMMNMLEPHLPRLGAFLYTKVIEFFRHASTAPATTPPAATSTASAHARPTSSATSKPSAQHTDVAAGYERTELSFDGEPSDGATFELETEVDVGARPSVSSTGSTEPPANLNPTPEQLTHLFSIRERLSPAEQALVEHVIKRMPPEMLMQYLGTLSAMTVDDGAAYIRSMVAQSTASPTP